MGRHRLVAGGGGGGLGQPCERPGGEGGGFGALLHEGAEAVAQGAQGVRAGRAGGEGEAGVHGRGPFGCCRKGRVERLTIRYPYERWGFHPVNGARTR